MRSGPGQPGKQPRDFGEQGYDPSRGGKPKNPNPQRPPKRRYPPNSGAQGFGPEDEEYHEGYDNPNIPAYPGSGKYPARGQGQPRGSDAGRYYGGQYGDPQEWDQSRDYPQSDMQPVGQYYGGDQRQSQYPPSQPGYQNYPKPKPRGPPAQGYPQYQGQGGYPQQPMQNYPGKGGFNKPPQKGGKNPGQGPSGNQDRFASHEGFATGGAEYPPQKNPQKSPGGDWSQNSQSMSSMGKMGPNQFGEEPHRSDQSSSQKKPSSNSLNPQSHSKKSGQTPGNRKPFGEYITYEQFEQKKKAGAIPELIQPGQTPNQPQHPEQPLTGPTQQIGAPVEGINPAATQEQVDDAKVTPGEALEQQDQRFMSTMAKLNTLDRGTYFIDEKKKQAHFLVQGRSDLLGWKDVYMINGYLLNGVIVKLLTLTSRIFLFIENLHPLYKEFIRIAEDGETALWTDKMPDKTHIVTVTNIEKVEVHDNDEDGFEGFVCYTVCEDSKIEFLVADEEIDNFNYVQELILLYEPTSIRKIYIDVIYNTIYKPESKGFTGRRIAAIINPNNPGQTITYGKTPVTAINKLCIVGSLWIQNGRYTLIAETLEHMQKLENLINLALDIAEELGSYVMITNLRRTYDYGGKTVLYIGSDPTLKLIKSNNQITFAAKNKQSDNLIAPATQTQAGTGQSPSLQQPGYQQPLSNVMGASEGISGTPTPQGGEAVAGVQSTQPQPQPGVQGAANTPAGLSQLPPASNQ